MGTAQSPNMYRCAAFTETHLICLLLMTTPLILFSWWSRFLLLAAALCAAASAFPTEQPMDMDMGVTGLWNAFKIDFNKVTTAHCLAIIVASSSGLLTSWQVYSPEEEAPRLVAFKDNVETIYRHNAEQAPTQGWTMGINEYSDMSSDGFSAMQGYRS